MIKPTRKQFEAVFDQLKFQREMDETINDYEEQIEQLKFRIKVLTDERDSIYSEKSALESALSSLEEDKRNLQWDIDSARSENDMLNIEIADLKQELAEALLINNGA